MGVITLALVAHGSLSAKHASVPAWVVIGAATAISLGTYAGGWRIIRTVGTRIIRMDAAQGFAAQGAGAAVILASSHFGYPLSSTHVISGGVMGAGAAKRLSAVRWGVAGNIAAAWIVTLPDGRAVRRRRLRAGHGVRQRRAGPAADHGGRSRRAADGVRVRRRRLARSRAPERPRAPARRRAWPAGIRSAPLLGGPDGCSERSGPGRRPGLISRRSASTPGGFRA